MKKESSNIKISPVELVQKIQTLPVDEQLWMEVQGNERKMFAPVWDEETWLLAEPPYDGMYLHYLCAKLDMMMQEYDSANTEMAIFTGLYSEYAKWYRRTHKPWRCERVNNYV